MVNYELGFLQICMQFTKMYSSSISVRQIVTLNLIENVIFQLWTYCTVYCTGFYLFSIVLENDQYFLEILGDIWQYYCYYTDTENWHWIDSELNWYFWIDLWLTKYTISIQSRVWPVITRKMIKINFLRPRNKYIFAPGLHQLKFKDTLCDNYL